MDIAIGIDTGGTYTDAVFVTYPEGCVVAGAKALTTRHDLSLGIDAAIRAVFDAASKAGGAGAGGRKVAPQDITLVSLSTTLATNTLAEGQRGRVCLLLIGYDIELMREYDFERELATDDVVYLAGGHDGLGNEVAPLDEAAAREAIAAAQGSRRGVRRSRGISAFATRRMNCASAGSSRNWPGRRSPAGMN